MISFQDTVFFPTAAGIVHHKVTDSLEIVDQPPLSRPRLRLLRSQKLLHQLLTRSRRVPHSITF
jgi:hypothetical protein